MSDRSSHQAQSASRKFVPDVNPLENRLLLSQTVTFPDGSSFVFPTFNRLPRTGGTFLQSGTALTIGVGQRTSNTVNISEQAVGSATVEWNGLASHSITGVQSILVQAGKSGHDQITINTGNPMALATTGASGAVPALGFAREVSHPVHALFAARTSPTAVQTGTVLTVTVTSPRLTALEISSWNFGHQVQLESSGSAQPIFTDVSTINVDIRNGTNDFVALDNAVAKGP
jgi:hypothetical protein